AEAEERLISAHAAVSEAERAGFGAFQANVADTRLTELGLRTDGVAGIAGRDQLGLLRNPDEWMPIRLHDGDLVAVSDHGTIITPITGDLTADAGEYFGPIQNPAQRSVSPDGIPSAAQFPDKVRIYRVHGDLDGARATASANPEFGAGGGTLLSVGDFDDAV